MKCGSTTPAPRSRSPRSSPRATASTALHFVPARSLDVADPPRVDIVVAEVLGNFAYEEDVLETLRDAQRFLAPGGTLIPHSIVQWVAPVTTDRFERDFRSWRGVGFGLDWSDAERMTRNNMYVFAIEPNDLLDGAAAAWDSLDFRGRSRAAAPAASRWRLREARRHLRFRALVGVHARARRRALDEPVRAAHALGPDLPAAARAARPRKPATKSTLTLESETGGDESGIEVRWTARSRAQWRAPRSSKRCRSATDFSARSPARVVRPEHTGSARNACSRGNAVIT